MNPDKSKLRKLQNDEILKNNDWYELRHLTQEISIWCQAPDLGMTVEEYKSTEFSEYLVFFDLVFYREI